LLREKIKQEINMTEDKKALQEEVERLEKEYQQAQTRPVVDRKQVDHLYKRLKKARKELKDLEEKK
jgi:hypothetical protein